MVLRHLKIEGVTKENRKELQESITMPLILEI